LNRLGQCGIIHVLTRFLLILGVLSSTTEGMGLVSERLFGSQGKGIVEPDVHVLETWGDYACYTSPMTKAERFSYACPTPSAVRGVFDAIYVKPGVFRWQVLRVEILNPIRYISFRRNEVKEKISVVNAGRWMSGKGAFEPMLADASHRLIGTASRGRTQRQTMALRDVRYRFHAAIIPWKGSGRRAKGYDAVFRRRASVGKCLFQPCFGLREFPCFFRLVSGGERPDPPEDVNTDLGWMLYDVFDLSQPGDATASPSISVFRAVIRNGVLDVPPYEDPCVRKHVLPGDADA